MNKKIIKSITLYESQISIIQDMAVNECEGDFGRAMRIIINKWILDNKDRAHQE